MREQVQKLLDEGFSAATASRALDITAGQAFMLATGLSGSRVGTGEQGDRAKAEFRFRAKGLGARRSLRSYGRPAP